MMALASAGLVLFTMFAMQDGGVKPEVRWVIMLRRLFE